MRHTPMLPGRYLAAVLFTAIGLGAYGCGDSATVNPEVELARLSVTPGTLQPAFSGGTTQYSVNLTSDTTTVTVSAQPAVSGDRVTIDGQETTSRTIALDPPGSTTVVDIVVSESNTSSRTYTVRLIRAGLAGNNSLQSLAVSPGTLAPDFDPNALPYTVTVASNVGSVDVTPTAQDSNATMTVNGQVATSGQVRTITLNDPGQSTTITITVTAQNGNPKTYLVTVSRGVSNNNNLQSLTISPGTLTPTFNASTEDYTVNVANTVGTVSITPTRQDPDATITVNGQAATSGQARTVNLNAPGQSTLIAIVVTAQNGAQKTYLVTVSRGVSANNNLQSLTISPGTLTPAFNASTLDYTVNVASTVGTVSIRPTRQDPDATITVNGQATNSGQARTITLRAAGLSTLISIVVTAQNGAQKTYVVSVNRAALGGNNNLSGLSVSPGPLAPAFAANTTNYTVDVASTVSSVSITATRQDPDATIAVNGQSATSGQARPVTLNAPGQSTPITIVVTAQNGTQKTYSINVRRAALGANNNLQSLGISPGTLAPTFSVNTTSYTVDVGSTVTSVTVTPALQDTTATMTVNGQATTSGQNRSVSLNGAGSNTNISIVVTAPNGAQKTYAITVERAALASNNNLSALSLTPGTLAPAFAQNTLNYTVSVASTAASVNVSATKADANAVMSGDVTAGAGVATGQAAIPLNGAGTSTSVSITVTAPNGVGKTYGITVNRAAPAAPPAPASAPDLITEDDSCSPGIPPDECAPGTSKEDNITNVATPRFTVAQPGAGQTPNLYVDGVKVKEGFDQGANTLTPTAALSDGEHTVTSTVTNAAGSESDQSPSLTVTINTSAPGAPTP